MAEQSRKLTKEERAPKFIKEPKPGPTHLICAICQYQFDDYYRHIQSDRHKRGVAGTGKLYSQIDDIIAELDEKRTQQASKDPAASMKIQNNPEEVGFSIKAEEDNSSGLAAHSKLTATGTEQSDAVEAPSAKQNTLEAS